LPATPALAGSPPSGTERGDQVVLSGDVVVHRSEVSGDVVIVHGTARVLGTVHGSVVVLDGPVEVSGTVDGDVVSLTGPTSLLAGARVKGDVWAPRGKVRIEVGAAIRGSLRRGNPLRLLAPSALVTKLGVWVAISASTLLLGFLLLLLAPRAADAVFAAVTARPGASVWWGVGLLVGIPLASVLAVVTLVGIPFGIGLLLALAFLYSVGYTWSVWVVGRALVRPSRHARRPRRYPAFLAGWAVMRAVGFVPFLGAATWVAGAAFGLGLMLVSVWGARSATPPRTAWTVAPPFGPAPPEPRAEPVPVPSGQEDTAGPT
jgi:cytoskeletal protein CcmA (bactofilin family)